MKKPFLLILVIILLVVFAVSAYQVGSYFLEGYQQAQKFDNLSDMVNAEKDKVTEPTAGETEATAGETETTESTESTEPTQPKMLSSYEQLYELNSDVVGWIKIEGTAIDYPVMQTPNATDFYLQRDFEKKDSARGCIYVREECDVFAPSDNVTIYGHTMKDGSMFAALHEYADKEVWEMNPMIFFDNLYEYHVYQIFSVFLTTASVGEGFSYHQMEWAEDEAEFDAFIDKCKDLALYDTGITPEYGDKIICLSTCEYSQDNGRLVVAAVRIS